jgi:hypothetical protein
VGKGWHGGGLRVICVSWQCALYTYGDGRMKHEG